MPCTPGLVPPYLLFIALWAGSSSCWGWETWKQRKLHKRSFSLNWVLKNKAGFPQAEMGKERMFQKETRPYINVKTKRRVVMWIECVTGTNQGARAGVLCYRLTGFPPVVAYVHFSDQSLGGRGLPLLTLLLVDPQLPSLVATLTSVYKLLVQTCDHSWHFSPSCPSVNIPWNHGTNASP